MIVKRTCIGILLLLMIVCSMAIASAENVVQMPYTLVTADYSRDGLYTGEAYNGIPDGYGLFESTNDDNVRWHYVGYWMDGLMDGEGATYWDDGALEVGTYYMGELVDGYAIDRGMMITMNNSQATPESPKVQYIGNKKSKKFHYTDCASVNDIKEGNKVSLYSRDEAINMGYSPCGRCKP